MNDDSIKDLYKQLVNADYDLDDEKTFTEDFKNDESFRKQIHGYMTEDALTNQNYDTWYNQYVPQVKGTTMPATTVTGNVDGVTGAAKQAPASQPTTQATDKVDQYFIDAVKKSVASKGGNPNDPEYIAEARKLANQARSYYRTIPRKIYEQLVKEGPDGGGDYKLLAQQLAKQMPYYTAEEIENAFVNSGYWQKAQDEVAAHNKIIGKEPIYIVKHNTAEEKKAQEQRYELSVNGQIKPLNLTTDENLNIQLQTNSGKVLTDTYDANGQIVGEHGFLKSGYGMLLDPDTGKTYNPADLHTKPRGIPLDTVSVTANSAEFNMAKQWTDDYAKKNNINPDAILTLDNGTKIMGRDYLNNIRENYQLGIASTFVDAYNMIGGGSSVKDVAPLVYNTLKKAGVKTTQEQVVKMLSSSTRQEQAEQQFNQMIVDRLKSDEVQAKQEYETAYKKVAASSAKTPMFTPQGAPIGWGFNIALGTDKDSRAALAKLTLIRDIRQKLEAGFTGKDKGAWDQFTMAIRHGASDWLFDETHPQAGFLSALAEKGAIERTRAGKGSEEDQAITDLYALKGLVEQRFGDNIGMMYKIQKSTGYSIPFIAEAFLSSLTGISKGVTSLAEKGGEHIAQKAVTKFLMNEMSQTMIKRGLPYISKGVGYILGSAVEATVQTLAFGAEDIGEDAVNRMIGNVGMVREGNKLVAQFGPDYDKDRAKTAWEAFRQAAVNDFNGRYSEYLGELFSPIRGVVGSLGKAGVRGVSGGLEKAGFKQMGDWLITLTNKDLTFGFNKFLKAIKFHGTIGEYGEEVLNNVMNAFENVDMNFSTDPNSEDFKKSVWNPDTNLETFLSCAYMTGIFGVAAGVNNQVQRNRCESTSKEQSAYLEQVLGTQKWSQMQTDLATADMEDVGVTVSDALESLPDDEAREAYWKYATANLALEGMELGSLRQGVEDASVASKIEDLKKMRELGRKVEELKEGEPMYKVGDTIETNFDGVTIHVVEDEGDGHFKVMYEEKDDTAKDGKKLTEAWMDQWQLNDLNKVPRMPAGEVEEVFSGSPTEQPAQKVDDRLTDDENKHVSADGDFKTALMPSPVPNEDGDNTHKVWIYSGNLTTGADGNIDVANSDNAIIWMDDEGNKYVASPMDFVQEQQVQQVSIDDYIAERDAEEVLPPTEQPQTTTEAPVVTSTGTPTEGMASQEESGQPEQPIFVGGEGVYQDENLIGDKKVDEDGNRLVYSHTERQPDGTLVNAYQNGVGQLSYYPVTEEQAQAQAVQQASAELEQVAQQQQTAKEVAQEGINFNVGEEHTGRANVNGAQANGTFYIDRVNEDGTVDVSFEDASTGDISQMERVKPSQLNSMLDNPVQPTQSVAKPVATPEATPTTPAATEAPAVESPVVAPEAATTPAPQPVVAEGPVVTTPAEQELENAAQAVASVQQDLNAIIEDAGGNMDIAADDIAATIEDLQKQLEEVGKRVSKRVSRAAGNEQALAERRQALQEQQALQQQLAHWQDVQNALNEMSNPTQPVAAPAVAAPTATNAATNTAEEIPVNAESASANTVESPVNTESEEPTATETNAESAQTNAEETESASEPKAPETAEEMNERVTHEINENEKKENETQRAQAKDRIKKMRGKADLLINLAHQFGLNVVFDERQFANAQDRGHQNGRTIVLNPNANIMDNVKAILGHEMTHTVEAGNEAYKKLTQFAMHSQVFQDWIKTYKSNGTTHNNLQDAAAGVVAFREKYAKRTGDASARVTMPQAINEVFADFFGEKLFADDTFVKDMMRNVPESRNFIRRFIDAIRELIAAITDSADTKELKRMADMMEDCLNQMAVEEADTKHSIDTFGESLGFRYGKDEETGATILTDEAGNPITEFSVQCVKESLLGAMIGQALKEGRIDSDMAEKQCQFFSDLVNMMIKTKDVDMVYAVSSQVILMDINQAQHNADVANKAMDEAGSIRRREQIRDYERAGKNDLLAQAGITGNADPQYSVTIDWTTICTKTQSIINTMSQVMKDRKRGLTSDEIVEIVYDEVHKGGEQTPCPVCYVFSRWLNLGKLFDNMAELQEKYGDKMDEFVAKYGNEALQDEEKVKAWQDKQAAEVAKRYRQVQKAADELCAQKAKEDPDAFKGVKDAGDRRKRYIKLIEDEYYTLQQKYNEKLMNKKAKALNATERARLRQLEQQIQLINEYSWFNNVRLTFGKGGKITPKEGYKDIPLNVLYDINASEEFSTNYPLQWKYRTTRGSGMGKASYSYSPMHVGQVIMGTNNVKSALNLKNNPFIHLPEEFDENGYRKMDKAALVKLTAAKKKAIAQNWLNGQRLQSTSDFRFEFGLDYLMAQVEEQTLGAYEQMYMKVPEGAPFMAETGAEINLSLVGHGSGFVPVSRAEVMENPEAHPFAIEVDGDFYELKFSRVTGIDERDAFDLADTYDNVQPILIGFSPTHMRVAMRDSRITFIIPYHSSGLAEARYEKMMQALGENEDGRIIRDFSPYQNDLMFVSGEEVKLDKNGDPVTEEKVDADGETYEEVVMTGVKAKKLPEQDWENFWNRHSDKIAEYISPEFLLDDNGEPLSQKALFDRMSQTRKLRTKLFSEAEGLLNHAPDGVITDEQIADTFSPEDMKLIGMHPMLAKIFNMLYQDTNNMYYGMSLKKAQQQLIMSHEYWDETTTYGEDDYKNSERFIAYSLSMGAMPRFSGWVNKGKGDADIQYIPDMDFTDEVGYWKTLIDRSMYNTAKVGDPATRNKYHEQRPVDLSALTQQSKYGDSAGIDLIGFREDENGNPVSARTIQRQEMNARRPEGQRGNETQQFAKEPKKVQEMADKAAARIDQKHEATAQRAKDLVNYYFNTYKDRPGGLSSKQKEKVEKRDAVDIERLLDEYNRTKDQNGLYASGNAELEGLVDGLTTSMAMDMNDEANPEIVPNYEKAKAILQTVKNAIEQSNLNDKTKKALLKSVPSLDNTQKTIEDWSKEDAKLGIVSKATAAKMKAFAKGIIDLYDNANGETLTNKDNLSNKVGKALHRDFNEEYDTRSKHSIGEVPDMPVAESGESPIGFAKRLADWNENYGTTKTITAPNGTTYHRAKKYGVGKPMGGRVYVHRDYATDVVPQEIYDKAVDMLPEDFNFNCVYYDPKMPNVVRFDEAPDFDTAREPIPGHMMYVDTKEGAIKPSYSSSIWHHKWMWVKDGYKGFNVRESYDWSKQWLQSISHPSGSLRVWNQALEEVGLPVAQRVNHSITEEIDEKYPGWFDETKNDNGGDNTQIAGTVKSYQKYGTFIKDQNPDATVLDASSGFGYGTEAMRDMGLDVDDVEPYPNETKRKNAPTFASYDDIDKQYDYVISNAVINVIPDDWRHGVMQDMKKAVKVGGKLIINTRNRSEVKEENKKNWLQLEDEGEWLVTKNGKINSYQKFYSMPELIAYVKKELGPSWTVERANEANSGTKGLTAVVATKVSEDNGGGKHSISENEIPWSGALGTPYDASKNKIARPIVNLFPEGDRFVDLFSGGGAITHAAILSGKYDSFHMNDKFPIGQNLFLHALEGKYNDYDKKVSKEEFADMRYTEEGILHSFNGNSRSYAPDKNGRSKAEEQIKRVKNLYKLNEFRDKITSSEDDYRNVDIQPGDVLYADIPYDETDRQAYKAGDFDYKAFFDWAQNLDQPVYISIGQQKSKGGVKIPEGFTEIWQQDVNNGGKVMDERVIVADKFADEAKAIAAENQAKHSVDENDPWADWDAENERLKQEENKLLESYGLTPGNKETMWAEKYAKMTPERVSRLHWFNDAFSLRGLFNTPELLAKNNIGNEALRQHVDELVEAAKESIRKEVLQYCTIGEGSMTESQAQDRIDDIDYAANQYLQDSLPYGKYLGLVMNEANDINKKGLVAGTITRKAKGHDVGLKYGEITHKDVDDLFKRLNKSKMLGRLYKKVSSVTKKLDIPFYVTDIRGASGESYFSGKITYDYDYFNDEDIPDQKKASTLLHELIHQATTYAIDTFEYDSNMLDPEMRRACREIKSLWRLARKYADENGIEIYKNRHGDYATSDADEWVAEMANLDWREKLKVAGLWERAKAAIKRLFKLNAPENNTEERMAKLLDYVLDNFDEMAYWNFRNNHAGSNLSNKEELEYGFMSEGERKGHENVDKLVQHPLIKEAVAMGKKILEDEEDAHKELNKQKEQQMEAAIAADPEHQQLSQRREELRANKKTLWQDDTLTVQQKKAASDTLGLEIAQIEKRLGEIANRFASNPKYAQTPFVKDKAKAKTEANLEAYYAGKFDNEEQLVLCDVTQQAEIVREFFGEGWNGNCEVTNTAQHFLFHWAAHHPKMKEYRLTYNMQENINNPDVIGYTDAHPESLVFKWRDTEKGVDVCTIIGMRPNGSLIWKTSWDEKDIYKGSLHPIFPKKNRGPRTEPKASAKAHPDNPGTISPAKVDENSDTTKQNGENLSSQGQNLTNGPSNHSISEDFSNELQSLVDMYENEEDEDGRMFTGTDLVERVQFLYDDSSADERELISPLLDRYEQDYGDYVDSGKRLEDDGTERLYEGIKNILSSNSAVNHSISEESLPSGVARLVSQYESLSDQMRDIMYTNRNKYQRLSYKRNEIAKALDDAGYRIEGSRIVRAHKASAITTFSGGGMIEQGLLGYIDPKVAVEYDKSILPTYIKNNGGKRVKVDGAYDLPDGGHMAILGGIQDVDLPKLAEAMGYEPVEYLHGSPVCKRFSNARSKEVTEEEFELDMVTAKAYADFIREFTPKVVTVENVAGYKNSEAIKEITDALEEMGYSDWDMDVYNAADYGGATARKRLIIRAVKDGTLPPKPAHTKPTPWAERTKDLLYSLPESDLEPNLEKKLSAQIPNWRNLDKPILVGGNGYGRARVAEADKPAFTITAAGREWVILPGGDVREATPRFLARISGLRDDYKLPDQKTLAHTIIGNGVPTELTRAVIAPIVKTRINEVEEKKEITEDIESRYEDAVNRGDNAEVEKLFNEYVMEQADDNIVPFLSPNTNYKKVRKMAHYLKGEDERGNPVGKATQMDAINEAAYDMATMVPENAVLIPIPSHTGKATDTLLLAQRISQYTGAPVIDALEGLERESLHDAKKRGKNVSPEMLGFKMKDDVKMPTNKVKIYIDNVVDKGNTAAAAVRAGHGGIVLAYVYSGKENSAIRLKSALAATYDSEGRLIPLSQRFNPKDTNIKHSIDENAESTYEERIANAYNVAQKAINTFAANGNSAEAQEEGRKAVSSFIRTALSKEDMPQIGKLQLTRIMALVRDVKNARMLNKHLIAAQNVVGLAEESRLLQQIERLLKLRKQGKNSKGISIAKTVDDRTRMLFDYMRGKTKDLLDTPIQQEIDAINQKIRENKQEIASLELDANSNMVQNRINQLQAENDALLEQKKELFETRKEQRDQNVVEAMQDWEARLKELNSRVGLIEGDTLDPDFKPLTDAEYDELEALTILKMINDARLIGTVGLKDENGEPQESIQKLEKEKADIKAELSTLRAQLHDATNKKPIRDRIKALDAQSTNCDVMINALKTQQIDLLRQAQESLYNLVEEGRQKLKEELQAENDRRHEIIKNTLDDIWKGKHSKEGQEAKDKNPWRRMFDTFFLNPSLSFEFMSQWLSNRIGGRGYLYRRFTRDFIKAEENFATNIDESTEKLNQACRSIFGCDFQTAANRFGGKPKKTGIHLVDMKSGERLDEEVEMNKGTALQFWMWWQNSDGQMKMRAMGYDEESIMDLEQFIGPDLVKFGNYLFDFYREMGDRVNEVHKMLFHTSMQRPDYYSPLKIDKRDTKKDSTMAEGDNNFAQTLNKTNGSLIKRTVNTKRLSYMFTAFDIVSKHIMDQEELIAFSRIRKDLDYMLSSPAVRKVLNANKTGQYDDFVKAAMVAAHLTKYDATDLDAGISTIMSGFAGGAIGWRLWTGCKQIMSYPAFYAYKGDLQFAKDVTARFFSILQGKPKFWMANIEWAKENLPLFKARWNEGLAGNQDVLREVQMMEDAGGLGKLMAKYSGYGMLWNRFVDAMTCAAGARAIYDFEYRRIKKALISQGVEPNEAHRQAHKEALMCANNYNTTQQSTVKTFISADQDSKTLINRCFGLFQNSNRGFTRQGYTGARDMLKALKSSNRKRWISQYMEDFNVDEKKANAMLNEDIRSAVNKFIMCGFGIKWIWDRTQGLGKAALLASLGPGGGAFLGTGIGATLGASVGSKYGHAGWGALAGGVTGNAIGVVATGATLEALKYTMKLFVDGMLDDGGDDDDDKKKEDATIMYHLMMFGAKSAGFYAQGSPAGNAIHDIIWNQKYSSPMSILGTNEMSTAERAYEKYGVSPAVYGAMANMLLAWNGIKMDTWSSIAMGTEDLIRQGFDADIAMDVMLILNCPKSMRQDVAKSLYGKYSPAEYARVMAKAGKIVEGRDNEFLNNLLYTKNLDEKKKKEFVTEWMDNKIDPETTSQYKDAEALMKQVSAHMKGGKASKDEKAKWQEENSELIESGRAGNLKTIKSALYNVNKCLIADIRSGNNEAVSKHATLEAQLKEWAVKCKNGQVYDQEKLDDILEGLKEEVKNGPTDEQGE